MSDNGDGLKVFKDEDEDYEIGERQQADFLDAEAGYANSADPGE